MLQLPSHRHEHGSQNPQLQGHMALGGHGSVRLTRAHRFCRPSTHSLPDLVWRRMPALSVCRWEPCARMPAPIFTSP